MIQVLFSVIFAEMALIVLFIFKTPLRKLVIMGLDRVKRGRGPIVVKTTGSTIFVVMLSTIYSVVSIRKRWIDEDGNVTPTDQILMAQHLLLASLMGISHFLRIWVTHQFIIYNYTELCTNYTGSLYPPWTPLCGNTLVSYFLLL